jgi:hypothetical protein
MLHSRISILKSSLNKCCPTTVFLDCLYSSLVPYFTPCLPIILHTVDINVVTVFLHQIQLVNMN